MKYCEYCKDKFEQDHWYWSNKALGKKHKQCVEHKKAIFSKYYQNNKKQRVQQAYENTKRNREKFNEWKKTLQCEKCDETHVACLEFHHTDPSIKEAGISSLISSGNLKRALDEAQKCIVLCSNCHRKHHYDERRKN